MIQVSAAAKEIRMTQAIQFHFRVGKDGVLHMRIPMGECEAGADVLVTVQKIGQASAPPDKSDWHAFVESTYGSCAGLGLERGEQGMLESREPMA
jgi:hypothetical protein